MTMHDDVDLDLDLSGGAGVLPLPADVGRPGVPRRAA